MQTNFRWKRGACKGEDPPSLSPRWKRGLGARRPRPHRQTELSLSPLWAWQPRESEPECVSPSASGGDAACLSRTEQLARPHPPLWGLAGHRVQVAQKTGAQLPPLRTTLVAPAPADPPSTLLELAEGCSCVFQKTNDSCSWIALCRKSRQVVASAGGDRSNQTCQRCWEAMPQE